MGGSSKKSSTDSAATTPTPQQPTMTVQPFMPGMQQALADQLAMGYGQQPADIMAYLSNIYKPMTLPDYSKPASTPAPATGGPSPVSGGKGVTGALNKITVPGRRSND